MTDARLTDRQLQVLAWASWWLFAVAMLGMAIVMLADPAPFDPAAIAEGGVFLIVLLPFPLAGVLILRRQPRNTVGWLLAGVGVLWGIGGLADGYAQYGLVVDPGSVPGPTVAATIANGVWAPAVGVTGTFLFLLFPDGHLPGRHWRPVALLSGVVLIALTLCLYLSPDRLTEVPVEGMVNPLGLESMATFLHAALDVLVLLLALCTLLSVVALARRFHCARGVERQQLKFLAYGAAIVGGAFVLGIAVSLGIPDDKPEPGWMAVFDQLSFLSFSLLPIAIGVAVLRYRLYDIDGVINRTIVYGALTACLAGAYLGSVLLLRLLLDPLTGSSDLAVATSTLAVAALFRPLRTRIQASVDRRFYRRKYDAALALDAFSGRLRQQVDLDAVGAELLATCRDTVQPTRAAIWLSEGRRAR